MYQENSSCYNVHKRGLLMHGDAGLSESWCIQYANTGEGILLHTMSVIHTHISLFSLRHTSFRRN